MKITYALSFLGLGTVGIFGEGRVDSHGDQGYSTSTEADVVESSYSNLDLQLNDDAQSQKPRSACVTLLFYDDKGCSGDPVRSYSFTTWTMPGSPCVSNSPYYSVKDDYCDLRTGTWYTTMYPFSTKCETHWYNCWAVSHYEIEEGYCANGIQWDGCQRGECPTNGGMDEDLNRNELFAILENGSVIARKLRKGKIQI